MSLDPLKSEAPLIVYIDIKSPYAFVAIKPTLALEARLGMEFDWRPLTLDIPSYLGSAKKSKGKVVESTRSSAQWLAVKYAYRDARRYAESQGYTLRGTEKIWDSSIVNIAISWIVENDRSRLGAYLEIVYPRFWNRDLDVEDIKVIEQCLTEAGITTDGFAAYQNSVGRDEHDALQAQLHDNGIYGVPTYVADGEIFFGRENLPYVEWIITGRLGNAPDIEVTR